MAIIIEPGDPREPEARALIEQSHALMRRLFPAEPNHGLSAAALRGPDIRFFVAREFDTTLGIAALAQRQGYGEVKSLFTAPFARGRGVGRRLLDRIELEARHLNIPLLRLETGTGLDEALALYRKAGFTDCGPFGDYEENGSSLFMEKPLT
ncbi:MAG: GNAT family N-acetyltransferase [Paracoccaceae bacterium]